mmetsp:Transcript_28601/g.68324  ORF Transcript_28601/g.68324 Transcript_28601/m.68324 type:complete len:216 (+) Transcript_28601:3957-4604(+)
MRVHMRPFLPPASLASSSLGIPVMRPFFLPSVFFMSLSCLSCPKLRMLSMIPVPVIIFLKNLSSISSFEPNAEGFSVSVSLVWESKAGFSMRQLTNTQMCPLTWKGLSLRPLCFLARWSRKSWASWSDAWLTCEPPRVVAIEFTNDTCWNWPSEAATTISQRSPALRCTCSGTLPSSFSRPTDARYSLQYSSKFLTLSRSSCRNTFTPGVHPAMS